MNFWFWLKLIFCLNINLTYQHNPNNLPIYHDNQCAELLNNPIINTQPGDDDGFIDELEMSETSDSNSDLDSYSDDNTLENIESDYDIDEENNDIDENNINENNNFQTEPQIIIITLEHVINNDNYILLFNGISFIVYENLLSHNQYLFNPANGELLDVVVLKIINFFYLYFLVI